MINLIPRDHTESYSYPEGYQAYIKGVEYNFSPIEDYTGYISLCIDARLPVSEIYQHFPDKLPISTAGNSLPQSLKSNVLSYNENVIVTHGMKPLDSNAKIIPQCGGHQLFTDLVKDKSSFDEIIEVLTGKVLFDEKGYNYISTTRRIANDWQATQKLWFYDHAEGWLYDILEQQSPKYIEYPSLSYTGINPKIGQDPSLLIINTTGVPYFTFSKWMKGKQIGGITEIMYPEPHLPEVVVQSLIFCIKNHLQNKEHKGIKDFSSSELILLIGQEEEDFNTIIKSILKSRHQSNRDYFITFNSNPEDIILGILPEREHPLFEIYFK